MRRSQLSRTAVTGSFILGCCVGICSPVGAAPADVRVVTPAPDKPSDPVKSSEFATGAGSQFELTFWQSVSTSEDADQLQAYLARYPNGTFSELARMKIAALSRHGGAVGAGAAVIHAAAPTVAPAAVPEAPKADAVPSADADDGDLVGAAAAIPGADVAVARVPVPAAQGTAAVKPAPAKPMAAKDVKLTPVPARPAEAAPAPAATALATPAVPTAAAAESAVPPSLAQQLRALGQSQGHRPEPIAARQSEPAALPQSEPPAPRQLIAIPSRPKLASVPRVDLPDHFCTAMERHDFYNSVYQPARSLADQNDRTATGHMLKLQSIYDDYAQRQDKAATDAIAVEVRDYETLASDAHHDSAVFEDLFNSLMAVPIRQCGEAA